MNIPQLPLVSIVTPTYNMASFLPAAIESVLSQDYSRIEYIVMDGGSTDGTDAVIARYQDRLRYFRGEDRGPSDAIHCGFSHARGEIFAWLNADDIYLPHAIRTGVDYLLQHAAVDVVYGEGYWVDETGAIITRYPTLPFDRDTLAKDCFICQPASFIRASAYRMCGLDPEMTHSFDYDLWIRLSKQNAQFTSIPQYLAHSRMHSTAKTIRERDAVFRASMQLLKRHYEYVPLSWIFGYTAFQLDGRDQFFEPLRPSVSKYIACLPQGLRWNKDHPFRFLAEWMSAPFRRFHRKANRQGEFIASI